MAQVTVRDIVRAHLIAHGYDGLCMDDCGCFLEGEFAGLCPCGGDPTNCIPGYARPDPDEEGEFIICAEKPGVADGGA